MVGWHSTEVTKITITSNYISEVVCYSDSKTVWDGTKGSPFVNNHVKKITVYDNAEVQFINFTPEMDKQYKRLVKFIHLTRMIVSL